MTPSTGDATVLVVDDNVLVLWAGINCVEESGYVARSAGGVAEALVQLHALPPVDVLFTDIDMPGAMNGVALAQEARRLDPSMGILFASGKPFPLESPMPVGGVFLPKPYGPEQVHEALATIIGHKHLL